MKTATSVLKNESGDSPINPPSMLATNSSWEPEFPMGSVEKAEATVVVCPFCSSDVSIPPNQPTGMMGRKRTVSLHKKHQEPPVPDEGTELTAQLSHVQLGLLSHLETCLIEGEVAITNPPPHSLHVPLSLLTTAMPHAKHETPLLEEDLRLCEFCDMLTLSDQLREHYRECLEVLSNEHLHIEEVNYIQLSVHHIISASKLPHPSRFNDSTHSELNNRSSPSPSSSSSPAPPSPLPPSSPSSSTLSPPPVTPLFSSQSAPLPASSFEFKQELSGVIGAAAAASISFNRSAGQPPVDAVVSSSKAKNGNSNNVGSMSGCSTASGGGTGGGGSGGAPAADKKLFARLIRAKPEETGSELLVAIGDAVKDKQRVGVMCLDNGLYLRPTKDGRVFADETSNQQQHFIIRKKDEYRFYLVMNDNGKYLFKKKPLGLSQGDHLYIGNTAKRRHLTIDKQSSEVIITTCDAVVPPPSSPRFRLVY